MKKLFTEEEILKASGDGTRNIYLKKGDILTPSASDLARELGIDIVREGDGAHDQLEDSSSLRDLKLSAEQMLEGYRLMARIRLFETKVSMLFSEGKIPGFVHLYSGEEAIAVGVCMALEREDFITSTHRGHGHLIAKGGDVNRMMAELFSRKTGYCSGKGGSMHIADTKLGILGANGIVGAGIPIAVGAALASKLSKTGAVAVSFFGDGASNQGTFHESLNMASIWKLPVVFVCENNGYAISISKERSSAVSDLATRAVAYAMDGVVVNGANVFEVYAAASNAISKARSGGGPTLIEAKTYRFCQHNEGGEEYRCPSYLECCKIYDPLEITKNIISENYPSLVSELDQIFKTEQGRIEEALAFALKSPKTDTSDALKGIYSSYINDAAVRGKVKN